MVGDGAARSDPLSERAAPSPPAGRRAGRRLGLASHLHLPHALPHHEPPATPTGVLLYHPLVIATVLAVSATLAVLAAVDGSSVLLRWDEPFQRWVERNRTDELETVFRTASRLGSNVLVFGVLGPLLVVVYTRCRTMAITLAISVLARPPIEFVIKAVIDRDRPDLDRLVPGVGPSHPSGHVLAAMALWGLLPPIVAALTHRHLWWWLSTAVGAVFIVMIAASRVYLGVHWLSDVIQGFLLGSLYLVAVEAVFHWHHQDRRCPLNAHLYEEEDAGAPAS